MKLLLDTCAFLVAISEPERLSSRMRRNLNDSQVERWVSVVSLWEIAVKIQIGKLRLPAESSFYLHHIRALKANVLDVRLRHSLGVLELPLHHKDPFDRLIVAQAREEGMTVVTQDRTVASYDVKTQW